MRQINNFVIIILSFTSFASNAQKLDSRLMTNALAHLFTTNENLCSKESFCDFLDSAHLPVTYLKSSGIKKMLFFQLDTERKQYHSDQDSILLYQNIFLFDHRLKDPIFVYDSVTTSLYFLSCKSFFFAEEIIELIWARKTAIGANHKHFRRKKKYLSYFWIENFDLGCLYDASNVRK